MTEKRETAPAPRAGETLRHREVLSIELPADLSAALDRLVERDHPGKTRGEALVAAFRDFATARGLVAGADEGLRPDELNASNDG